jgi:hypothetical protein
MRRLRTARVWSFRSRHPRRFRLQTDCRSQALRATTRSAWAAGLRASRPHSRCLITRPSLARCGVISNRLGSCSAHGRSYVPADRRQHRDPRVKALVCGRPGLSPGRPSRRACCKGAWRPRSPLGHGLGEITFRKLLNNACVAPPPPNFRYTSGSSELYPCSYRKRWSCLE